MRILIEKSGEKLGTGVFSLEIRVLHLEYHAYDGRADSNAHHGYHTFRPNSPCAQQFERNQFQTPSMRC